MSIEDNAMKLLRGIVASGAKPDQWVTADTNEWLRWSGAESNNELYNEIVPWLKQQGFLEDTVADQADKLTHSGYKAALGGSRGSEE